MTTSATKREPTEVGTLAQLVLTLAALVRSDLQAFVVSPAFEGIMLIKQHQMVMKPLKEAMASAVHALALKTFTPGKWEEARKQYNL